jgi:hypothetical protein
MARKPAHLELAGGKGLRQRIWDRIRARNAAKCYFALGDLVIGDECTATARDYVIGLERAGYLKVAQAAVGKGPQALRTPILYALARDAGAEAPRVRRDGTLVTTGLAQEQMWRTLRLLTGDTNARELAAHASTPTVPVNETAAADYLKNLHHAGYLRRTAEARIALRNGGRLRARYLLVSNTGPRPPMVCRADALYDPNLGRTVWVRPVSEEDAIYGQ